MVDFQTLVGDQVDNVPGVQKVGPRRPPSGWRNTARLTPWVANADKIKGVAGQNLRKALDWLPQARDRLLTVKTDCALDDWIKRRAACSRFDSYQ
ncbi:5'-3' exonuclease H3TH domain-containing protein [Candidatus Skiveiella danica]|uniref:5'-3' exonuclease H3TH domain-containing protein n=1 Tax=Candidatus Skiveiella danica TaxID=3386177 RepID=UPI001DD8D86A|nr:hypothetical protein [Betaproteobacteria bacterium]